jgi:uncharacterized protein (TIGR03089 family)
VSPLSDALFARARRRPADPLVTWYGSDSARAELSGLTFATAVAKTAGVLLDDWDVPPGSTVRLRLPLHWQVPVWLAACDLAGMVIDWRSDRSCDVVVSDDAQAALADNPPFPVVTATSPFGLPSPGLPADVLDHARDAMGQPDVFGGGPGDGRWIMADGDWDAVTIAAAATGLADEIGLTREGRLLVSDAVSTPTIGVAVWAAPVLLGAAVVLCPRPDRARVGAAEHTTVIMEP